MAELSVASQEKIRKRLEQRKKEREKQKAKTPVTPPTPSPEKGGRLPGVPFPLGPSPDLPVPVSDEATSSFPGVPFALPKSTIEGPSIGRRILDLEIPTTGGKTIGEAFERIPARLGRIAFELRRPFAATAKVVAEKELAIQRKRAQMGIDPNDNRAPAPLTPQEDREVLLSGVREFFRMPDSEEQAAAEGFAAVEAGGRGFVSIPKAVGGFAQAMIAGEGVAKASELAWDSFVRNMLGKDFDVLSGKERHDVMDWIQEEQKKGNKFLSGMRMFAVGMLEAFSEVLPGERIAHVPINAARKRIVSAIRGRNMGEVTRALDDLASDLHIAEEVRDISTADTFRSDIQGELLKEQFTEQVRVANQTVEMAKREEEAKILMRERQLLQERLDPIQQEIDRIRTEAQMAHERLIAAQEMDKAAAMIESRTIPKRPIADEARLILIERTFGEEAANALRNQMDFPAKEAQLQDIAVDAVTPQGKLKTSAEIAKERADTLKQAKRQEEQAKKATERLQEQAKKQIQAKKSKHAPTPEAKAFVESAYDDLAPMEMRMVDPNEEALLSGIHTERLGSNVPTGPIDPEAIMEASRKRARQAVSGVGRSADQSLSRETQEQILKRIPEFAAKGEGRAFKLLSGISSVERRLQTTASGTEYMSLMRRYQAELGLEHSAAEAAGDRLRKLLPDENHSKAASALSEGIEVPKEIASKVNLRNVNEAVDIWKTMRESVREDSLEAGMEMGFVENFFPHRFRKDVFQNKEWQEKALKHLESLGTEPEEAKHWLGELAESQDRRMDASFLGRKVNLPGYIDDDFAGVVENYLRGTMERVIQARLFGKKDSILDEMIDRIFREGMGTSEGGVVLRDLAKKKADQMLRRRPYWETLGFTEQNKWREVAWSNARAITSTALLGAKTAVLQPSQLITTATYTGVRRAFAGLLKNPRKAFRTANEIGVVLDRSSTHLLGDIQHGLISMKGGISDKIRRLAEINFKYTGIAPIDQVIRGTAVIAGRDMADELLQIAVKGGKRGESAMKDLMASGISRQELATSLQRGFLTDLERNIFARDVSRLTNIEPDMFSLPEIWESGFAKTMLQFKSFLYLSTKNTKEILRRQLATKGEAQFIKSLGTLLVGQQIAGEGMTRIRDGLAGRDRAERNLAVRMLDNFAATATLGLMEVPVGAILAAGGGDEWKASRIFERAFVPPSASVGSRLVFKAINGDAEGVLKTVVPSLVRAQDITLPHLPISFWDEEQQKQEDPDFEKKKQERRDRLRQKARQYFSGRRAQ